MRALLREEVEELVAKGSAGKALLAVHFALASEEMGEGDVTTGMGYLVFARSGGFMLAVPNQDIVRHTLDSWSEHGAPLAPGFHECTVTLETTRGRAIGEVSINLVDFPWGAANYLWSASQTRKEVKVMGFELLGQIGRPSKGPTYAAADAWITTGGMDDDTAADYVTGEELEPDAPEQPGVANGAVDPSVVEALQQRILELEQQVGPPRNAVGASPKQPSGMEPTVEVHSHAKAPPLFGTPGRQRDLSAADWTKLQKLAGPPPPRVGRLEGRRVEVGPTTMMQDNSFLLEEREVEEASPLEPLGVELPAASTGGTLEQLLAAQLQQNHLLLQKLMGQKSSDPVLGALSGSDNAGGSSSGVKGCIAREAFVKAMQDLPKVGRMARQQAMKELGIPFSLEDGSLMRTYMERRMCLAEHRMLSYFAMMLVESWSVAFEAKDELMMGSLAKMLFFVEQASIDNGRLQLAWLLTGMQDPPFHLLTSRKKQPGLQPFARLCPPSWVSGNLAYLRDLDYIEGRLQSLGKPLKLTTDGIVEEDPKPTPKRKAKPGKGNKKGKDQEEEA